MDPLTQYAQEGFECDLRGKPALALCPLPTRSAEGIAWMVGAWLNEQGFKTPSDVRMLPGYTMHANGMLLDVSNCEAIRRSDFVSKSQRTGAVHDRFL